MAGLVEKDRLWKDNEAVRVNVVEIWRQTFTDNVERVVVKSETVTDSLIAIIYKEKQGTVEKIKLQLFRISDTEIQATQTQTRSLPIKECSAPFTEKPDFEIPNIDFEPNMILYVVGNSLRMVYAAKKSSPNDTFHEIKTIFFQMSGDNLMTCRCNLPFVDRGVLFSGTQNNIRIIQFRRMTRDNNSFLISYESGSGSRPYFFA